MEPSRSAKAVHHYLTKYTWKAGYQTDAAESYGRFWAVFGREFMPWAAVVKVAVPEWAVTKMMRFMRRFAGMKSRSYPSLSVVTVDPSEWARCLALTMASGP